tara:strand:- start:4090 stop:4359 length:270 start_codon:yes stop_codon:yes gene_type:complete
MTNANSSPALTITDAEGHLQLNWETIQQKAEGMSLAALGYAISDCHSAGLAAFALAQGGCAVSKTQGYYADEASVYHAEVLVRVEAEKK